MRTTLCSSCAALTALAAVLLPIASPARSDELPPEARLRRPVALTLSADEKLLYAANQRSGSISILDVEQRQIAGEVEIGQRLSALKLAGEMLLATDEAAHELVLLKSEGGELHVVQRLAVSPYPVDIEVAADGGRCFVTSLWSRRLSFIALPQAEGEEAQITQVIDLPFAPREQLLARDDTRLIVADSFGSRLAMIDVAAGKVTHFRDIPGHNVRGLATTPDGKMLVIAHQMLNELAHTVRNDVHWGLLMSNDLRWLRLEAMLDTGKEVDLYKGAHMHPLGEASNATGDPSGLAMTASGVVVTALGGVDEVAVGKERDFSLYRMKVGRRPTAVVVASDGRRAFVANTFGDSISFIDLDERVVTDTTPLGPEAPLSLADKGELLFYDARLSHDSWMSCHSCHSEGHTNGSLNDNFSDASFGAPKRVLSLLGSAGTAPFGWNGSAPLMADQLKKTIIHTMQSDSPPKEQEVEALAAYLDTLAPPPSIDIVRGVRDDEAVERGEKLFHGLKCSQCHAPPAFTTPKTYNVGLRDSLGNDHFNPPSLRGVGQRGPYFHDNRAATLESVFTDHGHQIDRELSEDELRDLTAFLRSL